jgi:predicted nucleic acid-binding protein
MSVTGIAIPSGSKVFLDTSPFIYFIEEVEPYFRVLKDLFEKNSTGQFQIVTSPLTLTEVLTVPIKKKNEFMVLEYEDILLHSPFIYVEPFYVSTAKKAAEIRATYNIQSADAIQIASAISSGSEMFVTNDKRLSVVKEIKIVQLSNV